MTRTRTIWIAALALCALQACAETTPEVSSGSNWLTCDSLDDCGDGRAVRCSDDGYCLDADDERIEAAGPDAATEPPPSVPVSGKSSEPSPTTPPGPDASAPADAGRGATVTAMPNDAASQVLPTPRGAACDEPGRRDPLIPRAGETCYQFAVHGASSEDDTSPFSIVPGEHYDQFYYQVPWPAGSVATSYGVVDDASLSVHAWLFSTASTSPPGTVSTNVLGTLIGENARLLAAWATGGCNVVLPDDTGLELPSSGNVVVQWHFDNTGDARDDKSELRVCTVPAATRPNLAGITILGTENISIGAGAPPGTSQASGSCTNGSSEQVRVVTLEPYMHRIGTRMTAVIERVSGDLETVLDAPFQYGAGQHYQFDPVPVMLPGDVIRTTCSYDNATGSDIDYGQSVHQENCFLFAIAYPSVALDNGALSLIGATNTCW